MSNVVALLTTYNPTLGRSWVLRGEESGSFELLFRQLKSVFLVSRAVFNSRIDVSTEKGLKLDSLALLSLILILSVFPTVGASGDAQGYVSYRITINSLSDLTNSLTFVLNETVLPAEQPNMSWVSINFNSPSQNFTYSRLVNNSLPLFPILPLISNQSISYSYQGNVTIYLRDAGAMTASFSGKAYQLRYYDFYVSLTTQHNTTALYGNLSVFPSGLLFSFVTHLNGGVTLSGSLVGTNLALNSSSPSATEGVMIGASSAAVAAAIIIPWKVRKGQNSSPATPASDAVDRPIYWVD